MPDQSQGNDLQTLIGERFKTLPAVVQKAIASGNPEQQMRELSKKHQLHLDQWQELENVVMLTLLGVYHSEDLEKHVVETAGLGAEKAHALAEDIVRTVFEPVREELERSLGNPHAKEEVRTDAEKLRQAVLAKDTPTGTPGRPQVQVSVARAPVSPSYKPRESSVERRDVEGDPYREPPQ